MAKWIDEQGVQHDTDLLEYGNQGDTRYWTGTPGAVDSATWNKPKDQSGAVQTAKVTKQRDATRGPTAGPLYEMLKSAATAPATGAATWANADSWVKELFGDTWKTNAEAQWNKEHAAEVARLAGTQEAQAAGNRAGATSAVAASYRNPGYLPVSSDDAALELVARLYADQFGKGGTMADARLAVWQAQQSPLDTQARQWWESAMGMARKGMLGAYQGYQHPGGEGTPAPRATTAAAVPGAVTAASQVPIAVGAPTALAAPTRASALGSAYPAWFQEALRNGDPYIVSLVERVGAGDETALAALQAEDARQTRPQDAQAEAEAQDMAQWAGSVATPVAPPSYADYDAAYRNIAAGGAGTAPTRASVQIPGGIDFRAPWVQALLAPAPTIAGQTPADREALRAHNDAAIQRLREAGPAFPTWEQVTGILGR